MIVLYGGLLYFRLQSVMVLTVGLFLVMVIYVGLMYAGLLSLMVLSVGLLSRRLLYYRWLLVKLLSVVSCEVKSGKYCGLMKARRWCVTACTVFVCDQLHGCHDAVCKVAV